MAVIVDIRGVDVAFGERLVLKQVTLPVEQGASVGIIGPNGGGKTTLLRLIVDLQRPVRGTVTVAGMTPACAVKRGDIVGYLPQGWARTIDFPITVQQMIMLGLAGKTGLLRRYTREDRRFVDELIDIMGLRDLANRPVGMVSGGQWQRALIARALAPRPRILLLDEPTTGIDRTGQQEFIKFLLDLKERLDLTLMLVSHDLRAVTALCDRIACLNVTLHYHDNAERLTADEIYQRYACDLEAASLTPASAGQVGAPAGN